MAETEHALPETSTEAVPISGLAALTKTSLGAAVQGLGVTSFLVFLIAYFSFAADNFFTYSNWITILSTAAVIGIVSIGQTVVIIAGGFLHG